MFYMVDVISESYLLWTDSEQFDVASSGAITVAAGTTFDYDTSPSYTFVVRATDGGDPSKTATTSVTVNIQTGRCLLFIILVIL